MKKQFSQFKDFVHNNLSRNDKNEVLPSSVLQAEKHVDNIKSVLSTAEKKLSHSLVSSSSDSSSFSATPERRLKKLPSSSLSLFFNEASESLSSSKNDSVLGKMLLMCSQLQKESLTILTENESEIEKKCIEKLQAFITDDLPALSRTRKQLNRTNNELNTLRTKFDSYCKAVQNTSQFNLNQAESRLESLRSDLQENEQKLAQCQDAYETEIFNFLSKELNMSQVFFDYIILQAKYHERMLKQIEHYIPALKGVLANTSQKPVFGVPLQEHLLSSGRKISFVIETCIELLLPSIKEEGIFRISGSVTKVKLLRNAFNACHFDTVRDFNPEVHVVASTLKSYLRELPEPLLTFELYDEWIKAVGESDFNTRLQSIWKVCNALPEANRDNLCYLIKFLNKLSKHSDSNKMSSQNIAIAIGPSLFWSKEDAYELSMSNYSPVFIELLITYCDYFFPEDVIFECENKKKLNNSSNSDNSDPETSINISTTSQKQISANYRVKKPAPKPPSQSQSPVQDSSTNHNNSANVLDNITGTNSESTTSKIRSKFGSLRSKTSKSPNLEQMRAQHEKTNRGDSPPITSSPTATVRRNNLMLRGETSSKPKLRPVSICERPSVPPPSVPPRPSLVIKTQNSVPKTSENAYNMSEMNHIDSESEFDYSTKDQKANSVVDINCNQLNSNHGKTNDRSQSTSPHYPRLSMFGELDDSVGYLSATEYNDVSKSKDKSQNMYPVIGELSFTQSVFKENSVTTMEPIEQDQMNRPQKPPRQSLTPSNDVDVCKDSSKPTSIVDEQTIPLSTSQQQQTTISNSSVSVEKTYL